MSSNEPRISTSRGKVSLLDAVPVRCAHIATQWGDGCAMLAYPRFKHKWMRRFLLPKGMSPDIHVTLEERGSAIWRLMDGQHTVQDIISKLSPLFTDDANYAFRIATYVMQLRKDGFIELRVKD